MSSNSTRFATALDARMGSAAEDGESPSFRTWCRWTDTPLLILAIGSLPVLTLEIQRDDLIAADRMFLDAVNLAVLVAFAVDFVVKLGLSTDRWACARREWVGAVIVITSAMALMLSLAGLGALRVLRAVRPARVLIAAVRGLLLVGRGAINGRQLIRSKAFSVAIGVAGFTWLSAAAAFTLAEDVGADRSIESFFDALWWSAATITTVGYGDVAPETSAGRLAGLITMLIGISTFAVVTARFAAFLVDDD